MSSPQNALLIYCELDEGLYTLAREGEEWRQVLDSLPEALVVARGLAAEATPVRLYNQTGKLIIEMSVLPNASDRHGNQPPDSRT